MLKRGFSYFDAGVALVLFLSERAAFCKPSLSSGGLPQDCEAANAEDDGLSVAEDSRDLVASGALDIHEVEVGVLHKALQLVLALLVLGSRVKEVLSKRHVDGCSRQVDLDHE